MISNAPKHNIREANRRIRQCVKITKMGSDQFGGLGSETFGPLLTGFTLWLRERVKHDNISDLYFMSRDGYMMKLAFDELHDSSVRTHYLYCSRRAYTVPMLWKHPEFSEIFQSLIVPKILTVRRFLIRIGLEPAQWRATAEEYGLELDREYRDRALEHDDSVRAFYEMIKPAVIENSKKEYEALLRYIDSLGMDKRVGIVDIGYFGAMQNALVQLIATAGLDIDVKGYYVGVAANAALVNSGVITASGYLYERGKNEGMRDEIGGFTPIYESIFLAPHGSVKRFRIENGQSVPEMYEYEYARTLGEGYDEGKALKSYQEGAMAFFREYMRAGYGDCTIQPECALRNFIRMANRPTLSEAELWGDFSFFDIEYRTIAKPAELWAYLKRPGKLKKDFHASVWKVGFLRRLFKVPFPYYETMCLARRIIRG